MKRKHDDDKDKSRSKLDPIPLDLEVEILTRLPAKSLLKFRCVSEIWSSIIRSQRFVDSFFAMSSKRSRFIVALSNDYRSKPEDRRVFLLSSSSSHERNDSSPSLVVNLDMTIPYESLYLFLAGPCASVHGFLGVNVSDKFIICNPSTKQVTKFKYHSFLGYDPIDDQHKVLSVHVNHNNVGQYLTVLTLGGGESEGERWRDVKDITIPYGPISAAVCINGFLYYGAGTQIDDAFFVCFDVRSEKVSLIKAPKDFLSLEIESSILIEYKGKLASINVRDPRFPRFHSFDLWVLENVEKHEWSKQTCEVPLSVWDSLRCHKISFPGTNNAGEIIIAPIELKDDGHFYIFYYNVEKKIIRRVQIEGTEEIRNRYGFGTNGDQFQVGIIPQHVESLKDLII